MADFEADLFDVFDESTDQVEIIPPTTDSETISIER